MDILVVIDMQNDFCTEGGSLSSADTQAVVPIVKDLIESWEGIVFATMDTHESDYLNTLEGKKLPVEHCIAYDWGWQLNDYISGAMRYSDAEEFIISKPTFGSEELPKEMQRVVQEIFEEGMEDCRITLCGVCSDICVVSNALMLRAAYPYIPISVVKNACAGTSKEAHEAAMTVMKSCQIDVI